MNKRFVLLFCFGTVAICSGNPSGKVTTTVRVTTPDGEPVPDAVVGLSYARVLEDDSQQNFEGRTDEEGEVRFTGRAESFTHVDLQAPGFYYAYRKVRSYDVDAVSAMRVFADRTIELVAKEIRSPIAMLATRDFRPILPGPNERVGFDFFVSDLVEPYGDGKRADVYFLLEGEFQDRLNHDSRLTVEFAGQGDGMIPFEMDYDSGSTLESGHEAPESGYDRVKRTRKSIWTRRGLRPSQPGYVEYERANEVRKGVGYYIRIRTELDAEGNVISAHYGKIYGDFDFYGARPGGSFVTADAYYINPRPNDRNVEAVPGETLLEGVSRLDLPNRP